MIIVRIHAGLGNQLFQYAFARSLAERFDCEVTIDPSEIGSTRDYGLGAFNIRMKHAPSELAAGLRKRKTQWVRLVYALTRYDLRWSSRSFFMERVSRTQRDPLTFLVDPDRNDYYLEGFWQSERFFIDSADKVREEFTLREPLRGHNAELAARMAEVPSVSLHVRRGDYFAKAKFRRSFGVPLTDYYHRAMIFQAERIASPHFFVFSDDHDWVRANLHFDHPATFIQGNAAEKSYLDLVLMSRCKNHIIANSSFSWWGAWLDPNPEKVVTAPTPWFLKKWMITPGIVPEQWHEIPAF